MLTSAEHLSVDERVARGEVARDRVPPSSHTGWSPRPDRPDPVDLIEQQNRRREADLVPVRHGRMAASPFTFYRGAAAIMAADLEGTPTAGLTVQLCGDAHLSNFGVYGSPERRLVFDINDFDETLPGPFEYDVKRLAASLTVAATHNGLPASDISDITRATVASYREAMADFARMRTLDVWYAHVSEDDLEQATRQAADDLVQQKGKDKVLRKARSRNSLQALSKLTELVDGTRRIVSAPPVLVPLRELYTTYGLDPEEVKGVILQTFSEYRRSLQPDRRALLEKFEAVDWARKVVGVGSVGTRAFIGLLEGRDADDPLFLQIKEAGPSVLEGPLPRSRFRQAGERVVQGQRLMQASSDILLGWSKGVEQGRYFYWRQLRDMKGSAVVELMAPRTLGFYGGLCGWTLARAHARSGDPVAITAYLGTDDTFDRSVTDFALRYAEQNERDFAAFTEAIRTGRIDALSGV